MSQLKIDNSIHFPMPMGIVGTTYDNKPNFMAAAWITRANFNPPMVVVCIGNNHVTNPSIKENKEFSLSFPGKENIIETDYVGITSGKDVDKSKVFDLFYGELKKAPLIKNSLLTFSCKLVESTVLSTNTVFIGEVVEAWAEEEYYKKNTVDYKSGGAFILTMPDNNYWNIGENVGRAWAIGKQYKESH